MGEGGQKVTTGAALRWAMAVLAPDRNFHVLVIIYGAAISLLSLATPISVQMLINTVANTAMVTPLVTLALVLLGLLALAATLNAFRVYLMELFARRFYSRLVAEITLRTVHARNPFFQDARQEDLFNRYFDVTIVQKALPTLLISGFSVVLQALAGLTLTAFYHPFFLAFNLLVLALAAAIFLFWGRRAIGTGIEVSHAKYRTAQWLESIGVSDGYYKAGRRLDRALERSEELTGEYVEAKKRHFRNTFGQTTAYYMLYAAASAGLLALGGWLVIQGQLSIGQLVAAELILSVAFYGLSQLGIYLELAYDVIAAADELGLLYAIPQERIPEDPAAGEIPVGDLEYHQVQAAAGAAYARLDLSLPQGSKLAATAETHDVQRLFTSSLKRLAAPASGLVTIGGVDIGSFDPVRLRSEVLVLDRPTIVAMTIREYLTLACRTPADASRLLPALQLVGLGPRIARLRDGLDTALSATGWPLSFCETMQLKLAAAILQRPRIVVLSLLYDMVELRKMNRVLDALQDTPMTVICFTNRPEQLRIKQLLWLGAAEQRLCGSVAEFNGLRDAARRAMEDGPADGGNDAAR